jgi:hypothetical protein
MEKIWVIAWVLMTPSQGDGFAYEKNYGIAGPYDEHMCELIRDEIIDLAAARSESHALIATCRKKKPSDDTLLEKASMPKVEPRDGQETA